MITSCPDCRSKQVRRRKRSGISLYLISLLGHWPYWCEECGSNFLLKKRYVRPPKGTTGEDAGRKAARSGNCGRPTLTAPIGGIAAGDYASRGAPAGEFDRHSPAA
jgi:DNA-directed RNA polymerase subunit RPC12/RpoP